MGTDTRETIQYIYLSFLLSLFTPHELRVSPFLIQKSGFWFSSKVVVVHSVDHRRILVDCLLPPQQASFVFSLCFSISLLVHSILLLHFIFFLRFLSYSLIFVFLCRLCSISSPLVFVGQKKKSLGEESVTSSFASKDT